MARQQQGWDIKAVPESLHIQFVQHLERGQGEMGLEQGIWGEKMAPEPSLN